MRLFAKIIFSTATTLATVVSAASLEDAQKAYVSGNWKGAAEAFEAVCPTLDMRTVGRSRPFADRKFQRFFRRQKKTG